MDEIDKERLKELKKRFGKYKDPQKRLDFLLSEIEYFQSAIAEATQQINKYSDEKRDFEEYLELVLDLVCSVKCEYKLNPNLCPKKDKTRCPFLLSQNLCKFITGEKQ
jgi:hypothetical protein